MNPDPLVPGSLQLLDLTGRWLRVEASVTEVNGVLVWSPSKDHEHRSVPYPSLLGDAIAARLKDLKTDDLVFPSAR